MKCKYCDKEYASQHAIAGHMNFCKERKRSGSDNAIVNRYHVNARSPIEAMDAEHKAIHKGTSGVFECHDCIAAIIKYAKTQGYDAEYRNNLLIIGDLNAIDVEKAAVKHFFQKIAEDIHTSEEIKKAATDTADAVGRAFRQLTKEPDKKEIHDVHR